MGARERVRETRGRRIPGTHPHAARPFQCRLALTAGLLLECLANKTLVGLDEDLVDSDGLRELFRSLKDSLGGLAGCAGAKNERPHYTRFDA